MNIEKILQLINGNLNVINMGLESFSQVLKSKDVNYIQLDWRPPANGNIELAQDIEEFLAEKWDKISAANQKTVKIILSSKPKLIDIGIAIDVIPGMQKNMILHSGPPVKWERMCGPMKGGVIGGLIYEGLAKSPEEAEKIAESGSVIFEPCHHHNAVGPMAGIITPSMPVFIFENETYGNHSYATLNEGLGKVLRYGSYSDEVINRLKWMKDILAPVLKEVIKLNGPVDIKSLISQAIQMGDEGHNRNRAGTSLFIREIAPHMVRIKAPAEDLSDVFKFINNNDHFFLNLSMGAAKCTVDPAYNIENSSVIVTMARNGTEFGIKVSGLGDQWFTAPASMVDGLYFDGFSSQDAAPDIGDSVITETVGIGGFAMAAAAAIVKFVGGSSQDAINATQKMYEITIDENNSYKIPCLNFRGTPTGIDLFKVIQTGIVPVVNTGIAHKEAGVGMVGAGIVKPPLECFIKASQAFIEKYK